jgi:5-methylcytosine-specific restriction endonuclease McrA
MRREQIFERDQYRCVYCGDVFPAGDLTVDHVQARVRGGDHSGGNLVTACRACNTAKGHRRVGEFLRDNAAARTNFFRYALHLWPRLLRGIREFVTHRGDRRRQEPG